MRFGYIFVLKPWGDTTNSWIFWNSDLDSNYSPISEQYGYCINQIFSFEKTDKFPPIFWRANKFQADLKLRKSSYTNEKGNCFPTSQNFHMAFCYNVALLCVVYFDQNLCAAHCKHSSKSPLLCFSYVMQDFDAKIMKNLNF